MKKFNYKAKDRQGNTVGGVVEASDEKRALAVLQERGLVVFRLRSVTTNIASETFDRIFRRITLSDTTTFTRQLSTMITTGLTVTSALRIIRGQGSPSFVEVIDDIVKNVEGGTNLADAMQRHPGVFNQVYVSLVRAGERAGVLDQIMLRLADNLERQREFNAKIKGAMVYPAVVVIGMGVVGTIMMVFVIPKMVSLYQDFQAKLPTPTLVLIGISNFLISFWWIVLLVLGGGVFVFRSFRQSPFGRRKLDELILKIPVWGNLQTQVVLAETTRTLGLLVSAGISIVEALNITAAAVGNTIFEERLNDSAKQVEKGTALATALSSYEEFPPLVSQMVSIGEETGKMDEVLLKVSRYFEQESEQMVKGLTNLIEPLIMVVLGLGVAFLVIAIIMPIYNLTSQF